MTDPGREERPGAGVEAGRDIQAGRDIAGRDIISPTTYVGFSPGAVLRLVLAVGGLVFVTAACFFTGGIVLGAGVFQAFERQVDSNPAAAASMQTKLQAIASLPAGQLFDVILTEEEISSYFRFVVAPQVGVEDGRARLLSEDRLAITGQLEQLGGLQFIATFEVQKGAEQPLRLESVAIKSFGSPERSFGWMAVPKIFLEPLADQINDFLGGGFQVVEIGFEQRPGVPPRWEVRGVTTR